MNMKLLPFSLSLICILGSSISSKDIDLPSANPQINALQTAPQAQTPQGCGVKRGLSTTAISSVAKKIRPAITEQPNPIDDLDALADLALMESKRIPCAFNPPEEDLDRGAYRRTMHAILDTQVLRRFNGNNFEIQRESFNKAQKLFNLFLADEYTTPQDLLAHACATGYSVMADVILESDCSLVVARSEDYSRYSPLELAALSLDPELVKACLIALAEHTKLLSEEAKRTYLSDVLIDPNELSPLDFACIQANFLFTELCEKYPMYKEAKSAPALAALIECLPEATESLHDTAIVLRLLKDAIVVEPTLMQNNDPLLLIENAMYRELVTSYMNQTDHGYARSSNSPEALAAMQQLQERLRTINKTHRIENNAVLEVTPAKRGQSL